MKKRYFFETQKTRFRRCEDVKKENKGYKKRLSGSGIFPFSSPFSVDGLRGGYS